MFSTKNKVASILVEMSCIGNNVVIYQHFEKHFCYLHVRCEQLGTFTVNLITERRINSVSKAIYKNTYSSNRSNAM